MHAGFLQDGRETGVRVFNKACALKVHSLFLLLQTHHADYE